jgi:hypothetical protein
MDDVDGAGRGAEPGRVGAQVDIAFGKASTFPLLDAFPQDGRWLCPVHEPRFNIKDEVCGRPISEKSEKLIEIVRYGNSNRPANATPSLGEHDPSDGARVLGSATAANAVQLEQLGLILASRLH